MKCVSTPTWLPMFRLTQKSSRDLASPSTTRREVLRVLTEVPSLFPLPVDWILREPSGWSISEERGTEGRGETWMW